MAEQITDRVESSSTRRAYREDWDTAIRRLASEAEAHGIQIFHHDNGQGCVRYFATSQSEPGALHYVTLTSCDCRGFAHHGRCRHLAALLAATGNLPEPPADMDVVTEAECPTCHGTGSEWLHIWTANGAQAIELGCSRCQGHGTVAAVATVAIDYQPRPAA